MAEVKPLRTLRYESGAAGPLEDVIAPPYDVIDDELRAELVARSPFNVVEIDLPRATPATRTSTRRPRWPTGASAGC